MSDRKSRSARGTTPPPSRLERLTDREILRELVLDASERRELGSTLAVLLAPAGDGAGLAWTSADVVIVSRALNVLLEDAGLSSVIVERAKLLHFDHCWCCRVQESQRQVDAYRSKLSPAKQRKIRALETSS